MMRSENGQSVFDHISGQVGLEADAVSQVKSFFTGTKDSIQDTLQAYVTIASTSDPFADRAWERIKWELILGKSPSVEE